MFFVELRKRRAGAANFILETVLVVTRLVLAFVDILIYKNLIQFSFNNSFYSSNTREKAIGMPL